MRKIVIQTTILVGLLLTTAMAQNMDSREGDSLALLAIYNANSAIQSSWNISENISTWQGVNLTNGRVDSINLAIHYISILPAVLVQREPEKRHIVS